MSLRFGKRVIADTSLSKLVKKSRSVNVIAQSTPARYSSNGRTLPFDLGQFPYISLDSFAVMSLASVTSGIANSRAVRSFKEAVL